METLEPILGESTTPSNDPEKTLDLRGNQGKPNGRGVERGRQGGRKDREKEEKEKRPLEVRDQRIVSVLIG